MSYTWSKYSTDLFDAVAHSTDNLQVSACPGSGKTTNCKEIWQRYDNASIAYLVFNKANADEAKSKLPDKGNKSYIGTMHSLCLRAINSCYEQGKRPKVDTQNRKVWSLIRDAYSFAGDRLKDIKQQEIKRLVSLLKGIGDDSSETIKDTIMQHDLWDYGDLEMHSRDIYQRSLHDHTVIDFDDMLLFAVAHKRYNEQLQGFSLVLGDEGQDFNPIQLTLLGHIAERLVVVGDPHQAIYGFRGALNDSLAQVRVKYQAREMPLNLTYRCPKKVVSAAQGYYPDDICCLPTAPEGHIRTLLPTEHSSEGWRDIRDSLVVCRTMAPLVTLAYTLLRGRTPVRLRGRDIGQNLIRFIKQFEAISLRDMLTKLDEWYDDAVALARSKGDDTTQQALADKYQTVQAFAAMSGSDSLQELYDGIAALFASDYGLELSTIHRAKGLEATRLYWLGPELCPSKYAKQPWQLTQEANIAYVALTRSKDEVVYMPLTLPAV